MHQIGSFLFEEGFKNETALKEGIFEIINLISDYQEEGKVLFPEILITNSLELLKTITDVKVPIGETPSSTGAFKRIIKYCAPLSSSEWKIYIEAKDGILKYGMTCAELTETTPSLFTQTVGDLKLENAGFNVAYIHNIGKKVVELKGIKNYVRVSLSLNDISEISANEIGTLAKFICGSLSQRKDIAMRFLEKVLSDGFKEGHGNLVGVIDNTVESKQNLMAVFPEGIYFPEPIDIVVLLNAFEMSKSAENSVALRQHAHIVKSMVNNDGIAVFTSDGKLVAYHIIANRDFIPTEIKGTISGGARTQAFYNMKYSKVFLCGLMKSQDGPIKLFKSDE